MNNTTLLQPYRKLDIQIFVIDYEFNILDEISGVVESASFNIDGDSDIRRTADITMMLKSNYTNTGVLNDIYFQAGNGYWFDKYLQIRIGVFDIGANDYTWFNQGVYLINEPSINYDATTNSLSFQAVDLMSKMTGLRNGYLEGQDYSINTVDAQGNPTNATITGSMSSLLELQNFYKYVLFTPEQNIIPQDILISAGGTTYDLLSQLRDINSNWEIFFDVDGTFYFQKIPSGEIITSSGAVSYDEHPTAIVDDMTWDKLLISWNLSTDFESVKNYVEVYGKTYETENTNTIVGTPTISGHSLTAQVDYDMTGDNYYHTVIIDLEDIALTQSITSITLTDTASHSVTFNCTPHIRYGNTAYLVRVNYITSSATINATYVGYFQPEAVAWENNPNSPFYVGDVLNVNPDLYDSTGTATTGKRYNIGDRVRYNNKIYICTANDTYGAWDSTKWYEDIHFVPVFEKWNGATTYHYDDIVYYNQALWISVKDSGNVAQIPNEKISTYWQKLNKLDAIPGKLPLFEKMIRGVCVGDNYDNIATNQNVMECASYELYNRCRLHDTINITCVPIYDLDVNKIMSITLPNEGVPSYWLIKSISTTFEPTGTQSITATRYYPEYPIFGSDITYN